MLRRGVSSLMVRSALTLARRRSLTCLHLEPPAGQLRFPDPMVVNFTSSLFKAVAPNFPSKFMSTGGDELNANCYTQDAKTQQLLSSSGQTLEEALNTFTVATHNTLAQVGKTPVVWEGA